MSEWLDRFAEALAQSPLSAKAKSAILTLARDVAHGTERINAPLATFVAGYAAGLTQKAPEDAANEALEAARRLLPEASTEETDPPDD